MERFFSFISLLTVFLLGQGCATVDQEQNVTILKTKEGKTFYTGLQVPKDFSPANVKSARDGLRGDLPAEFDARVKGYKTPENQGSCGSCWAFSMSATVQDSYKYQLGKDFDTSEQHILSCTKPGEWTCGGGFFDYNRHMSPYGGVTGASWPYSASDETCRSNLNHQLKIKQWSYTPGGENPSIDEIKAAIYRYGIVSVGVAADDAFSSYSGGVFQGSGSTQLNHAVNLVGWSDAGQYWILKNSWGNWGEQGYMRIRYGANGVGTWANYVVFDGSNPDPNPDPGPNPPPPPPPCSPQPYADTGYGDSISVRQGQQVILGTRPRPGHFYWWTAEPSFDNNGRPDAAQIKYRPRVTKRLTVWARTQCGTESDSVTVKAMMNIRSKTLKPEVE